MMPLRQSTKNRPRRNPTDIKPFLQGRDGTVFFILDHGNSNHLALVELVCLRFAQRNEQAQAGELQVFHVDTGQFRPAQGPVEADQENGLVADLLDFVAFEISQHFLDVVEENRYLAVLDGPFHALDAPQGVLDDGVAAGIFFKTGSVKIFRQRADAPGNGIGLGIVGQVVDVIDDGLWFSRERRQLVIAAPVTEIVPVRAVGVDGIGGPCRVQALAGFIG